MTLYEGSIHAQCPGSIHAANDENVTYMCPPLR